MFGYTLLLSLAAGVIFGLAPAVQASSPQISAALREEGTFLGGARSADRPLRDALVVVQIAVCLMLLAAAALTARSLQRTQSLDLGFRTSGVVYTRADLRPVRLLARRRPRSSTGGSPNARTPCRA